MKTKKPGEDSGPLFDVPEQLIRKLSELLKSTDLSEIELSKESFRVRVKAKEAAPAVYNVPSVTMTPSSALSQGTSGGATKKESSGGEVHMIRSPFVGTFYRSASPSAPAFVEPGQVVNKGQVLCIIEAMKIMNEIEADATGVVEKIYAENGTPVDFNAPLFDVFQGTYCESRRDCSSDKPGLSRAGFVNGGGVLHG